MADRRNRALGIKSGPQRVYEFLADKPVGYHLSVHSHRDHIPLHTGKLSSAFSSLEASGVLKAVGRQSAGRGPSGRRISFTLFQYLGPKPDIVFKGGHRPGFVRTPGDREGICPRRLPPVPGEPEALAPEQATIFPAAIIAAAQQEVHRPVAAVEPPAFLPPAPTLSEQLLLLAIQIDRARKPGTPSSVFKNSAPLREVGLPSRRSVVERLLELATLAEALEAERRDEPAPETADVWRY